MADWTTLATTDAYATLLASINDRDTDLARGMDPAVVTVTNPPTNAIRWSSSAGKWQKWSGAAWGDLAATYNINVAGTITAPVGSVGAPSIAFAGASTTGFYAPAADRVALSIAGTQRLYITGTGRFSFGAGTSPAAPVTVAGGGLAVQESAVNRALSFLDAAGTTTYGSFGYDSTSTNKDAYVSNAQTGGFIKLKIAGTDRVTVSTDFLYANVHLQMQSGKQILLAGTSSATAPAIAHVEGGNDTGIFFPTSDGTMAVCTNAVERTRWDDVGGLAHYGHFTASGPIKGNGGGLGLGSITVSTSAPSGGASGDIWLKY